MIIPRANVKDLEKEIITNKKPHQTSKQAKTKREMRCDSQLIQCISDFTKINLSQIIGNGKIL